MTNNTTERNTAGNKSVYESACGSNSAIVLSFGSSFGPNIMGQ